MKNLIFLLLLVLFSFGYSQNNKAIKLISFPLEASTFIGYDDFGIYYYIENNTLFKSNSKEKWQYKNTSLGSIAKVDFTNSMMVILFYEDFNSIVLLDNQFNEIKKINISENNTPIAAAAIGNAFGNRLWIYNNLTQQIGILDYLKNEYQPITIAFSGIFEYYQSDYNYFYWIDEKQNWNRCDIYGKNLSFGKVPYFDQIQIVDELNLIYSKNQKIFLKDIKNEKIVTIEINEKTFKSFFYKDQILSIFTNEGITNYKITLP